MQGQEYVIHYGKGDLSPLDECEKFRVMRLVPSKGEGPMLKSVTPRAVTFGEAKWIADEQNVKRANS